MKVHCILHQQFKNV